MSAIAGNAGASTKGIFSNLSMGGKHFKEEFAQALALKLNITTTQRANEKALMDLTKASGSTAGLKQALQARAALYGDLLEPSWFARNTDLSAKANSLKKRRVARAMLSGAVLLVAQLGAHEVRSLLSSGQEDVLKDQGIGSRRLTSASLKNMAKASPLEMLKFVKWPHINQLTESLLRHADDLDFLQTLITSLGNRGELNPSLNAVHMAYSRRRFTGRFKTQNQSIELDTLLQQETRGTKDDDALIQASGTKKKSAQSPLPCHAYQKGPCTFNNLPIPT